jgi:hypothetical protein
MDGPPGRAFQLGPLGHIEATNRPEWQRSTPGSHATPTKPVAAATAAIRDSDPLMIKLPVLLERRLPLLQL